jgi:putative transposase
MGIARFATLRKAKQAMSQKVTFSSNWKRAKTRVQKIHARIANVRSDFLLKHSTAIIQNHAILFVEDLQARNMSKSVSGTTDNLGKNVGAKSGLNKAILDQDWSEFRRQLDYKLSLRGSGYL